MPKPIQIAPKRPDILLDGDYHQKMSAIQSACKEHGFLYEQAGTLVRVRGDEIDILTATKLQSHLIDLTRPIETKTDKEGNVFDVGVDKYQRELCQHLIDRSEHGLDELEYVYRSPVYGKDWELYTQRGYQRSCKAWIGTRDFELIEPLSIEDAKREIETVLQDFPFADKASKTHAIMALITAFVRPQYDLCPLFFITAPTAGTGKSLLASIIGIIVDGTETPMNTAPDTVEEWRKTITSILLGQPATVVFDNVNDIDSSALASVLTTPTWSDRYLGTNTTVRLPNRAIWIATGNNPTLSEELTRRVVSIRMVASCERPADRPVHIPDLKRYVLERRVKIATACLSLVHHWIQAGQPLIDVSMGSFQQWATLTASIAAHAGYTEALTNADTIQSDDAAELRQLVTTWAQNPSKRTNATAKDLEQICEDEDILGAVRNSAASHVRARKVAAYVSKSADRVIGEWRIQCDLNSRNGNKTFSLISVTTH